MKRFVACFAVITVIAILAAAVPAPAASGGGVLKRMKFSNFWGTYTADTTYPAEISQLTLGFNTIFYSPMLITFSGSTGTYSGGSLGVSVQIDGVDVYPGEIWFDLVSGDAGQSHSYTWAAAGIPPGYHTIRVMAKSYNGTQVFITNPTLVVMYRR